MGDRELTEDEVADLKEAFAMFDINGDGAFWVVTKRKWGNGGMVYYPKTCLQYRVHSHAWLGSCFMNGHFISSFGEIIDWMKVVVRHYGCSVLMVPKPKF